MHGRPRAVPGAQVDPEKAKAAAQRLTLLTRLSDEVLSRRAEKRSDPESLKLCAALLEHNPEVYTAWNWRREVVGPILDKAAAAAATTTEAAADDDANDDDESNNATSAATTAAAALEAATAELELTEKSLRRNPKCYSAWHHRRWVLLGRPFLIKRDLLKRELALVDRLLDADARNFHAWAHRRAVAAEAAVPAREIEAAALARVESNFSNCSAWHERSATLLQLQRQQQEQEREQLNAGGDGGENDDKSSSPLPPPPPPPPPLLPPHVLERELDLVRQATFTDPEDQAPWLYHRWLLSQSVAGYERRRGSLSAAATATRNGAESGDSDDGEQESAHALLSSTLEAEAAACEELLEAEPDRLKCKWPLLALARLAEARAWLEWRERTRTRTRRRREGGVHDDGDDDDENGGKDAAARSLSRPPPPPPPKEAVAIYKELAELDPMRKGFYNDAAAGRVSFL